MPDVDNADQGGGAVTRWIEGLQQGDERAAQALWERYYARLLRQVQRRLVGAPRRMADEEDVAQNAFKSLFLAARAGRFPQLADRHDLWRLLLRIAARKAVDLLRYQGRQKRRVLGESVLKAGAQDEGLGGLAAVVGREPSPEFAAQVSEESQRLLAALGDPELEAIALAKLEGRSNDEIARLRDCSRRSIERQLQLIRRKWEHVAGDEPTA